MVRAGASACPMIAASYSSGTTTTSQPSTPARASSYWAASRRCAMSTRAFESPKMYASSSAFRCQFTSTTGASSFVAAAHASKNSMPLGSITATRSPACTPRTDRACASRLVRSSNSANVRVTSPLMSAALFGVAAAWALIPSRGDSTALPGVRATVSDDVGFRIDVT